MLTLIELETAANKQSTAGPAAEKFVLRLPFAVLGSASAEIEKQARQAAGCPKDP